MGEVAAFTHVLTHTGMLKTIQEQVRFARARALLDFCSEARPMRVSAFIFA
jgi:hypothetical protein